LHELQDRPYQQGNKDGEAKIEEAEGHRGFE
jgi:hypothetical protein